MWVNVTQIVKGTPGIANTINTDNIERITTQDTTFGIHFVSGDDITIVKDHNPWIEKLRRIGQ